MEIVLAVMVVLAVAIVAWLGFAQAGEPPKRGAPAPEFALEDPDGGRQTLAAARGTRVALVFHPQDETPECVAVVERLQAAAPAIASAGVSLWAVVVADPQAARAYAQAHAPGVRVLCDPGGKATRAYGALVNLGFMKFARKQVVLVDPWGKVERTWRDPVTPVQVDELARTLGVAPAAGPG